MSRIFVHGCGAASPAGWSASALCESVSRGSTLPTKPLPLPGREEPLTIRQVPIPDPRPAFFGHARLRRTSPISQYLVAAAMEAVGSDAALVAAGKLRLGVVLCVMSGCVNYSRRFYDEALRDPSTASPLVFPETVFNAPASHIAAMIGTPDLNYTLVGDPGTFLQGLALAATWLLEDRVDACLVAGGEECDWLTSTAFHLFSRSLILSDGAGALYLKRIRPMAHSLNCIPSPTHIRSLQYRPAIGPRKKSARSCRNLPRVNCWWMDCKISPASTPTKPAPGVTGPAHEFHQRPSSAKDSWPLPRGNASSLSTRSSVAAILPPMSASSAPINKPSAHIS